MAETKKPLKFYQIEDKVFFPLSDNYLMYICDVETFSILSLEEVEAHIEAVISGLQVQTTPRVVH